MTHTQIKTQISKQYLSIGGIGYINHQHMLDVFGIKPQEVSGLLIKYTTELKAESVYLVGDTADIQTYLDAEAILYLARFHAAPFSKDTDAIEKYAAVMDSLLAVSQMDKLEILIDEIKVKQGVRFVPPVCSLSEVSH